MKKTFLFLAALMICAMPLYAQTPKIEKSEIFDEPSAGWNKVLQLSNGNTFYFHMAKKEGIEVSVYDKNRRQTATTVIESEQLNMRKWFSIIGLYEINKEPVLFVLQAEHRTPTLYRIRFDRDKGTILKEEEIGSMPKISLIPTNLEGANVIVEKDPASDAYAVIYFNGFSRDADEKIKVVHYNGEHKTINIAHYESPDENFKYLRFIGAVVDGTRRLYLATYGAASQKGKDAHVYISRLNSTDSVFFNKRLEFTEDFKDTKSVMYYNRTSNNIQLLTVSFSGARTSFLTGTRKGYYTSFLSMVDPETLALRGVKPATNNKITDYAQNKLQLDFEYKGLPHQMVINADNSITVLSEELATEEVRDARGNVISQKTRLGAIGVTEYNEDGTEKIGYMFNKAQLAAGIISPLYITARAKGIWAPLPGFNQARSREHNSYLSFDYVNTERNRYILFNDDPSNFEKAEDNRKRRTAVKTGRLSTVCYSINDGNISKSLPFVDEKDDDIYGACLVETSDFSRAQNTYATVLIEHDKRNTSARIVWMTFP